MTRRYWGWVTVFSVVLGLGYCAGHTAAPVAATTSASAESASQRLTATTTTTSSTTTTTAPPPRSFTLVAAGDVLLHSPLWRQALTDGGGGAYDFAPLLAGIAPTVAGANLAICHLETPLAPPGGPYSSYPVFSVPPEIATALATTGFDACTTASNHTYDKGADGIDRTLNSLDAAGIAHAGSARTPEEAGAITLLPVNGATVALLSYAYGFNGIPAPRGEVWRSNEIDEARILADAARARQAGADVVVVALHWGNEYSHEPSAQQQALAPTLIRSPDIDLLVGHHAHVVEPVEPIDGEWVVYGMGNMIAYQGTLGSDKEEGLLMRFTFTESPGGRPWRTTAAEFGVLLTERDRSPTRLIEVGPTLADPSVDPGFRARLDEAWSRTVGIVDQRGALQWGLTSIPP